MSEFVLGPRRVGTGPEKGTGPSAGTGPSVGSNIFKANAIEEIAKRGINPTTGRYDIGLIGASTGVTQENVEAHVKSVNTLKYQNAYNGKLKAKGLKPVHWGESIDEIQARLERPAKNQDLNVSEDIRVQERRDAITRSDKADKRYDSDKTESTRRYEEERTESNKRYEEERTESNKRWDADREDTRQLRYDTLSENSANRLQEMRILQKQQEAEQSRYEQDRMYYEQDKQDASLQALVASLVSLGAAFAL